MAPLKFESGGPRYVQLGIDNIARFLPFEQECVRSQVEDLHPDNSVSVQERLG
jgi:hypothetical protein